MKILKQAITVEAIRTTQRDCDSQNIEVKFTSGEQWKTVCGHINHRTNFVHLTANEEAQERELENWNIELDDIVTMIESREIELGTDFELSHSRERTRQSTVDNDFQKPEKFSENWWKEKRNEFIKFLTPLHNAEMEFEDMLFNHLVDSEVPATRFVEFIGEGFEKESLRVQLGEFGIYGLKIYI